VTVDPITTKFAIMSMRPYSATQYKPPPAKEKWKMYLAVCIASDLNGSAKAVLSLLIDRANNRTGRCDPGEELIMKQLGMAERTVVRSIATLVGKKYVERVRRGKVGVGGSSSNAYQVNWDKLGNAAEAYKARAPRRSGTK
jgi:hypothetical protein